MKLNFDTLDKDSFEKLCKRLVRAEVPDAQSVNGSGGDEGVDSFKGIFNCI